VYLSGLAVVVRLMWRLFLLGPRRLRGLRRVLQRLQSGACAHQRLRRTGVAVAGLPRECVERPGAGAYTRSHFRST
jgi:hypothetical protein